MSARNTVAERSKRYVSNCRMTNPHHDPSIDAAVIGEFIRRFPALTFLSFFRNCSSQALHVIHFVGQRADLVAAGIPVRDDLKRCTGAPDQLWWYVTRDRRRKVGMLVATLRLDDVLPADHPMAWLEPRNWPSGAAANWTSADVAAAAKAWADTYGRRKKITQIQPVQPKPVERVTTSATILHHERFDRVPAQPQMRRRGPLPHGVGYIEPSPRLRVGALVEIVSRGKRARVLGFDDREAYSVEVQSLDGPTPCNDGSASAKAWVKPSNLRRVWTGLSEDERIKLKLLRVAS